jgi:hypothetical protein
MSMNIDGKGCWSDDLKCFWLAWECVAAGRMFLTLPPHSVCDMRGAIKAAADLMPEVHEIQVAEGSTVAIVYMKTDGKWTSHRVAPAA